MHIRQLGITPKEIQQWCDNESAVSDSNRPLVTPAAMIKPDADILLAIHHLRSHMERHCTIHCTHIYGHQDTRPRGTPAVLADPSPSHPLTLSQSSNSNDHSVTSLYNETLSHDGIPSELCPSSPPSLGPITRPTQPPLPVRLNIECDHIASTTSEIALGDHRRDLASFTPPYPGSKAMLRIGDIWITSKLDSHVLRARWTPQVIDYCLNKYGWDHTTFNDIAWKTIGAARWRCTPTQPMRTSKIMHGWLPVKHMLSHIQGSSACPLCAHSDETLDHIFHCPHPVLAAQREILLEELQKKGLSIGIPRAVMDVFTGFLLAYIMGVTPTPPSNPILFDLYTAQQRIGFQMLPRGFLSISWINTMAVLGCANPYRKLSALIYQIWTIFTDSIWKERNRLTHDSHNYNDHATEHDIDSQLIWYSQNFRTALSRQTYRLIKNVDPDDLDAIPLRTKRQMLLHLDAARDAFSRQIALPGQTRIAQFFSARR